LASGAYIGAMKRFLVAALAAPMIFSSTLSAQAPAPDAVTTSFRFFAYRYGTWLVDAFESIPASSYGYRPTPVQQSVGHIAQHLEGANYGLCGRLNTVPHAQTARDALPDSVKDAWPKDTLVARLRASLAYCDAALKAFHDPRVAESGAFGVHARTLIGFVADLAEHYSQIASYMRLLNLTPPSAGSAPAHIVADVPMATLSQYVGRYALAASAWQDSPALTLEVTLNDGALMAAVVGRPARRLWPESATDFFVKESDLLVKFVRDGNGAVTGLVLRQIGEDRPATKMKP
jgi:hypothetical protein